MSEKYLTNIRDIEANGFEYTQAPTRHDLRRNTFCFFTNNIESFYNILPCCIDNLSGIIVTKEDNFDFSKLALNLYHLKITNDIKIDLKQFCKPYVQIIKKIKEKNNALSSIAIEIERERRDAKQLADHYLSIQESFRSSLKVYADWTIKSLIALVNFAKDNLHNAEVHELSGLFTIFLTSENFKHKGAAVVRKINDEWVVTSQSGDWGTILDIPLTIKHENKPWSEKNLVFIPMILTSGNFLIIIKKHDLLEYQEQELDFYRLLADYAKQIYENKKFADDIISTQKELEHKKRSEALGNLVSGVAHEINTPVQYIGDNVHFILESFREIKKAHETILSIDTKQNPEAALKKLEKMQNWFNEEEAIYTLEETQEALVQSQDGIKQISQIISALKIFMHPGSKDKEPININNIIENVITVSRSEWKKCAKIKTNLCKNPPIIDAHKNEISQAILNLIVNAAHAISEKHKKNNGGIINVTTRIVNFRLEVIIQDNGIGIENDVIDRIFDPFFTTKETGKGTGQGLYLVYNTIVSNHKGKITCKSEPNKGTEFKIILNIPVE
jgi:signal transduction histidine kinase